MNLAEMLEELRKEVLADPGLQRDFWTPEGKKPR